MKIQKDLIEALTDIIIKASDIVMEHYQSNIIVEKKSDGSPVSNADFAAHQMITKALKKIAPSIPIISEEDKKHAITKAKLSRCFWLVDPLDGTREFIQKNDEFSVNIALIKNQKPILGLITHPPEKMLYVGINDKTQKKAYQAKFSDLKNPKTISISNRKENLILIGSRSHQNHQMLTKWMEKNNIKNYHPLGSSLKFCKVANGSADIYLRLGPTMLWDSAAGHAILEAAGGLCINDKNEALIYNPEALKNPPFMISNQSFKSWPK